MAETLIRRKGVTVSYTYLDDEDDDEQNRVVSEYHYRTDAGVEFDVRDLARACLRVGLDPENPSDHRQIVRNAIDLGLLPTE